MRPPTFMHTNYFRQFYAEIISIMYDVQLVRLHNDVHGNRVKLNSKSK